MAKKKRHHLVVTITHDKPVSRKQAVAMFRDVHCLPGFSTNYFPQHGYYDVDVGEGFIVAAKSCPDKARGAPPEAINAELLRIAKQYHATILYYLKKEKGDGDKEGARLKTLNANIVQAAIDAAEGRS